MGDMGLGVLFIVGWAIVGGVVAMISGVSDPGVIVITALAQQLAMFAWPIIVTRWKGVSLVEDWGLRFKWVDPLIGLGLGVAGIIAAALASQVVAMLLGVSDTDGATNTGIIAETSSSPWLIGSIFVVVIGAPFSEELFFRGLCLRSVEKRFGPALGAIVSTVLFTVIHVPDELNEGWAANLAILWASIATLGMLFAVVTLRFGRLGPAIFGHITVNLIVVVVALATLL